MTEPLTRSLAAIMFADMVGFTALMQADEGAAQHLRDRYRQVLATRVSRHGGRIRQYYGDGALSTFDSAVEAVRCALEIQRDLASDPVVPVRIGVHTGDIVHDPDGVYGDGVNVASRVEGLCAPGGIMISGKVHDEIKNQPSISTVAFGGFRLKNVAPPVQIFAISNEGVRVPSPEEVRAAAADRGGVAESDGIPAASREPAGEESPAGPGEALLQALRRRSMFQWTLAYFGVASIVLMVFRFGVDLLGWPTGLVGAADLLAFVGFLVTVVVTWYHGERGRQRIAGTEIALIGGLLAVAVGALTLVDVGGSAGPTHRTAAPAPDGVRPSVVVLPFENLSPDPEDAYFAHGIQEDITTALSRIRSLRVPGRSSVEQYRNGRPDHRVIAATLSADYLLEGTALVAGSAVRITVALVDARSGDRTWSERYDREFTVEDVIAVQADVAREVATRLRALISPEDSARMTAVPTPLSEAWELWQRARYRWNRRREVDVRDAMDLFRQAIGLDPTFAAAHAGLADVFLVLANWGWMDHRVAYPSGIAAAERALQLDSLNAAAHASLGGLRLWSSRDWTASEIHFRRAIELDYEYSYAHYWYSALLGALGRHEEATAEASLAWEIDPLAPQVVYGLARSWFLARNYDQAERVARQGLDVHADYENLHSILCSVHIAAGSWEEAERSCDRVRRGDDGYSLSLGILRAHQGRRAEAAQQLDRARRAGGGETVQPVIAAMVYAGLGDADTALTLLTRAVDEGYPHAEYLSNHPFFDPLQDDPRYQALLARLKLPGRT